MKKVLSILCVICLAAALVACGSSDKEYNVSDVLAALDAANPLSDGRALTEDEVNLSMNISSDLYEEFAGTISNDATTGALNVVFKAVDGKASEIANALSTYQANQVSVLEPYAPENAAILEDATVQTKGNYVMVVFGASADVYSAVDTAIADTFK